MYIAGKFTTMLSLENQVFQITYYLLACNLGKSIISMLHCLSRNLIHTFSKVASLKKGGDSIVLTVIHSSNGFSPGKDPQQICEKFISRQFVLLPYAGLNFVVHLLTGSSPVQGLRNKQDKQGLCCFVLFCCVVFCFVVLCIVVLCCVVYCCVVYCCVVLSINQSINQSFI